MKKIYFTLLLAILSISFPIHAATYTLNQASGSFGVQNNNYVNEMSEIWEINTGSPSAVKFTFSLNSELDFDYLLIYSIDNNGVSNCVYNSSGFDSGTISTILPTGKARVIFSTDESVCYNDGDTYLTGFTASFSVDNSYYVSQDLQVTGKSFLNGNVGIGTLNPLAGLHILKTSPVSGNSVAAILGNDYNHWTYFGGTTGGRIRGSNEGYLVVESNPSGPGDKSLYLNHDTPGKIVMAMGGGNVGIGTQNPNAKLEVLQSATTNGNDIVALFRRSAANTGGSSLLRLEGNTSSADLEVNSGYSSDGHRFGTYFDFNIVNNNSYQPTLYGGINFVTNSNVRITIKPSGNIGIGTTTPNAKLDVTGEIRSTLNSIANVRMSCGSYSSLLRNDGVNTYLLLTNINDVDGSWNSLRPFRVHNSSGDVAFADEKFQIAHSTGNIIAAGKIGIGLSDAATKLAASPSDELLTVNGIIHAKEVRVDLTGSLADYVFNSDYSLMPLHKVESFVKTNKHLPEIPSAAEVKEKGLNMGEMQNKLLQKIEELTLYVIEQQKELQMQRAEIDALKRK